MLAPATHVAPPDPIDALPAALLCAADFGIARVLKHTMECAKTVVGTPYYLSPVSVRERASSRALFPLGSDATKTHGFSAEHAHTPYS
jgi:hypothetical protein